MYELKEQDKIFVFTGPHGAGRKTVAEMAGSTLGIKQVISYTTRPQKPTEVDGQDYHFITKEQFLKDKDDGNFLEVTDIDTHLYGIQHMDIEIMLGNAGAIYLILNRFGAEALKRLYADHVVRICIYAGPDVLETRMLKNGHTDEEINLYMSHYHEEMQYCNLCEHSFENIDIAHTVFDLTKTLDTYLHRNLVELD
ncbi:guanylate kinase [Paenibacillus lutrae]|uniref:Guanylate kinase n=1 Tax=Paenibacillus lutrae TaxID=2078573 RepID=A0A7X3FHS6_9BACL|nr:guanylate kinase [Paenibacillus lutrae]MVO99875.1 guanylate kinase [Paenibacillus lutrae]